MPRNAVYMFGIPESDYITGRWSSSATDWSSDTVPRKE